MGTTTYARISRFTAYRLILFFKQNTKGTTRSGLTMVELVVAIAVIGILTIAGISLLNPGVQINRANDAKRKANLATIQTALELFRSVNGFYPTLSSMTSFAALVQGSPQYLPKNPNGDPKSSDTYYYTPSPPGCDNAASGQCTGYSLITCLENTYDSDKDLSNDPNCASPLWSKTVINP